MSAESRRVELCQCPSCGREIQLVGEMARLEGRFVIALHPGPQPYRYDGGCPVCGLVPGEPDG